MDQLHDFAPFVKTQADFHARRARNPNYSEDRKRSHAVTAEHFDQLLKAIENTPVIVKMSSDPLSLSPDDLTGLPPELLAELNISESDKLDALIVEIINGAGGTLLLDKILIALYKRTNQVHSRNQTINRIYQMKEKGLVRSVSGRKGVYTTLSTEGGDEEEKP